MTQAYYKARQIIKEHLGATSEDILISSGSGMTDVINKFQAHIGIKITRILQTNIRINQSERPVVFVTHMEHHSNPNQLDRNHRRCCGGSLAGKMDL